MVAMLESVKDLPWRKDSYQRIRFGDSSPISCHCPLTAVDAKRRGVLPDRGIWSNIGSLGHPIVNGADHRASPYRNAVCRALGLPEDAL